MSRKRFLLLFVAVNLLVLCAVPMAIKFHVAAAAGVPYGELRLLDVSVDRESSPQLYFGVKGTRTLVMLRWRLVKWSSVRVEWQTDNYSWIRIP